MTPGGNAAARELLTFYLEAGVDALVDETPVDRLADEAPPPIASTVAAGAERPSAARSGGETGPPPSRGEGRRSGESTASMRAYAAPPPAPEAAVMAAREAARSATSLAELRALLERFEGCALRTTATQLCFADGNPEGRVMFVGEAPGRDEDLAGVPFVGRSGKLLDLMMAAIGLDRTSAYVANIIPWRPPGNRDPSPQETTICLPFVRRQIELANPDVLVCLGKPSSMALLDIKDGILKNRGRWFSYDTGTRQIRATVTLHPAYLLRQPLQKRLAWRDFLAIKKALG